MKLQTTRCLSSLAFSLLVLLHACGGGGGSGGPADNNPAPKPEARQSTNLGGVWRCTRSALYNANTTTVDPYGQDDLIALGRQVFVGDAEQQQGGSYQLVRAATREDIERNANIRLDWYTNQVGEDRFLDYGFGSNLLARGSRNVQYGLRLAVLDSDTIAGFEAALVQDNPGSSQRLWIYELRFERVPGVHLSEVSGPGGGSALAADLYQKLADTAETR